MLQQIISALKIRPNAGSWVLWAVWRLVMYISTSMPHTRSWGSYQCGHEHGRERPLIDGASTFNNIRLDQWQREERNQGLFIGQGVGIKAGEHCRSSAASCAGGFSEVRTRKGKWKCIWKVEFKMEKGGSNRRANRSYLQPCRRDYEACAWWTWMFALRFRWKVGVAVAVYFLPWADLLSWLRRIVSRLGCWIMGFWKEFLKFLDSGVRGG